MLSCECSALIYAHWRKHHIIKKWMADGSGPMPSTVPVQTGCECNELSVKPRRIISLVSHFLITGVAISLIVL